MISVKYTCFLSININQTGIAFHQIHCWMLLHRTCFYLYCILIQHIICAYQFNIFPTGKA